MALVSQGYWMTITLADAGDNRSTIEFQMTAPDAATAATDAATILANTQAITDSVVAGYSYGLRFGEDALSLPAGVQNANKASLTFALASPNKKANRRIPGATIGIFVAAVGQGENIVDIADPALLTWSQMFETGGECLMSDGEVSQTLLAGKRVHAKTRIG